jgi:hypothetical protein
MIEWGDSALRSSSSTMSCGYIEGFDESDAPRFRAKRMFSARRPSLPLGEFWSIEDAIDCFRFC